MKKTLLVIAAISVALPVLAKMPSIDVRGEIRVRGEEINNAEDFKNTDVTLVPDYDDKDSHVKHRVRVCLDSELSDGVGAHICLQKADDTYWWAKKGASSLNNLQDNITLRRANITIDDVAGLVDLTLGRQAIGKKDNELVMCYDAIDAKKAEAKLGNLSLTGICAKDTEAGANAGDNDTDIQGLTGSIKLDVLSGVNLTGYGYRAIWRDPNKDAIQKTNDYGAKVSGSMDIASTINYSVEYVKESGTPSVRNPRLENDATALRVCLGYNTEVEGLGALAIEGSYLKMSGEKGSKTAYEGIYSDIDYYAALVDQTNGGVLVGANGRKDVNVNIKITPEAIDNVTLGISYTKFTSAEKTAGGKTDLGSELDLSASYKYSDTTSFGFTYAKFTPGNVQDEALDAKLGAASYDDAATMLRCELLTKF